MSAHHEGTDRLGSVASVVRLGADPQAGVLDARIQPAEATNRPPAPLSLWDLPSTARVPFRWDFEELIPAGSHVLLTGLSGLVKTWFAADLLAEETEPGGRPPDRSEPPA